MVKYLLATLLVLCPVLAYAQSTIIVEQTLSGDPIGSGYSAANGALYAPTSASLQSLALPFTISYDLISPSAPSSTANYMYSGVNSPNTGFNIFYNTTFTPDIYHLQAAIRPAAGTAITGASCDGTGKMCWRPPLDNVSHHYCWVFTPNHMWWYLDGIVRDESITPGTFTASSITWTLLQSGIPANNTLFDVRTYSRALTANECVTLSRLNQANLIPNSGSLTTGMLLHLKLNDCVITGALYVCPDTSGNSNPNATNDQAPPVVVASAPSPATGNVNVTASCTDPAGIACAKVCYLLDGYPLSLTCPTTSPYTYAFPSANVVDGAHTISAVGYNAVGISGTSAGVAVTTSNSKTASTYYFNGTTGSDSNTPCTSSGSPCQTFAKLATIVLTGGDTVNLAGAFTLASTYTLCAGNSGCATQNYFPSNSGALTFNGGNSCNPFTLTTTNCAILTAGTGVNNFINGLNAANTVWKNTAVIGTGSGGLNPFCVPNNTTAAGVGIYFGASNFGTAVSVVPNITVTNNWVKDFACLITINGTSGESPLTNVTVSDNVSSGTAASTPIQQGIRFNGLTQGTIEGNLSFNIGGTGEQGNPIAVTNWPSPPGAPISVVQFNVAHDFGGSNNTVGGPIGIYAINADFVLYQFNESYRGLPPGYPGSVLAGSYDYDCYDGDTGSTRITFQFNYAHDCPIQSGFNVFVGNVAGFNPNWNNNIWRYNIAEKVAICFGGGLSGNSAGSNTYIYNNSCAVDPNGYFSGSGGTLCYGVNFSVDLVYANNLCIYTGTSASASALNYMSVLTPSTTTFINNDYFAPNVTFPNTPQWAAGPYGSPPVHYSTLAAYQSATGFEANSLNVDPQLVGTPGTGGTCWGGGTSPPAGPQNAPSAGCPTPYVLSGANLKGKGVHIPGLSGTPPANPTTDYYGNGPISNPPNIGAYGGS